MRLTNLLFFVFVLGILSSCSKTILLSNFTDVETSKKTWACNPGAILTREGVSISGAPGICTTPVQIKPNTIYQFVVKIRIKDSRPEDRLSVDLNRGAAYDNLEQELQVLPASVPNNELYVAKKTFKSGNPPDMVDLRVFSFSKSPWIVESVELIQR